MEITIICGPLCSGKTSWALTYDGWVDIIDIGDIVRKITHTQERVQESHFDQHIIHLLYSIINFHKERGDEGIAITGIRQRSILNAILGWTRWNKLHIKWLEVPVEELKERYLKSHREKDKNISFEQAYAGDAKLGLEDLEGYLKTTVANYVGIDFKIIQNL